MPFRPGRFGKPSYVATYDEVLTPKALRMTEAHPTRLPKN